MKNSKSILLDYYDGAYGPTIRIDTQSIEALIYLKNKFIELASSIGSIVAIAENDIVGVLGLNQLILKNVPETQAAKKRLKRVTNDTIGIVYALEMSSIDWRRAAGLIDGLIEFNQPGHQYLSQEGVDDVLLELAFMEGAK